VTLERQQQCTSKSSKQQEAYMKKSESEMAKHLAATILKKNLDPTLEERRLQCLV